jgi:hypothetical protein
MIAGNPDNDEKGSDDNLVPPEENLFHSCGLSSALDGVTFTDNCDDVFLEELCPGEHRTQKSWAGMIYKRDEISDFLEDMPVADSLVKRQDSGTLVNETNFPTLEEATLICTNLSDHHIALNELILLVTDDNDMLVHLMNEVDSLIDGCASEVTLVGHEGATSLCTIQLTLLVIISLLDTLVETTLAVIERSRDTEVTSGEEEPNQTTLNKTMMYQIMLSKLSGNATGDQV